LSIHETATTEIYTLSLHDALPIFRAIASKPSTARGMSDNLILDEFAHHQDNRAIWTALLPVVSRPDLKLRVISTPNGRGDKFYEDRKSTRLNSSHVKISYAVFCLK